MTLEELLDTLKINGILVIGEYHDEIEKEKESSFFKDREINTIYETTQVNVAPAGLDDPLLRFKFGLANSLRKIKEFRDKEPNNINLNDGLAMLQDLEHEIRLNEHNFDRLKNNSGSLKVTVLEQMIEAHSDLINIKNKLGIEYEEFKASPSQIGFGTYLKEKETFETKDIGEQIVAITDYIQNKTIDDIALERSFSFLRNITRLRQSYPSSVRFIVKLGQIHIDNLNALKSNIEDAVQKYPLLNFLMDRDVYNPILKSALIENLSLPGSTLIGPLPPSAATASGNVLPGPDSASKSSTIEDTDQKFGNTARERQRLALSIQRPINKRLQPQLRKNKKIGKNKSASRTPRK